MENRQGLEIIAISTGDPLAGSSHYDPNIHHRRSIRLPGYDYSQAGMYFVTICTHNHVNLLGEVINGEMRLNQCGVIVRGEWERSALIRAEIELGAYVIMPNHFHCILTIIDIGDHRTGDRPVAPTTHAPTKRPGPTNKSIGAWVGGFKSAATKRINILRSTPGTPVWQRNYFEHIVRSQESYEKIAAYIANNPAQWETDQLFT